MVKKVFRRAVHAFFHGLGLEVHRRPAIGRITPWEDELQFLSLFTEVDSQTLVDKLCCYLLVQFARHTCVLPGHVAEVGVYRGGSARLLAGVFKGSTKELHLFDTFAGLPKPDPKRDLYLEGELAASYEEATTFLEDYENIVFHPGLFPETAIGLEAHRFCFVHVDVDLYQSVYDCCEFFYPRLVQGGVMIFDDYGSLKCPGAKLAVDEFFQKTIEHPCHLGTTQALLIKHFSPNLN